MPSIIVKVGSAVGLHARPAAIIAEKAAEFDAEVTLEYDDSGEVDAASSLMIMTLGAENGAEVTVASDDEAAMNAIAELIAKDLDAV